HGSHGHDAKFFAQLEWLLRKKAPITISNPEAGAANILRDIVPARFALLKRKMDRLEARRRKPIDRLFQDKKITPITITDQDIIGEFEDAASEMRWKEALLYVGLYNGLVDEGGRPVNQRARRLVARGRKAHSRARRMWNPDRRFEKS